MSKYFDWPGSLKRFVRFDAARAEDVNDALDELTAGVDVVEADIDRALKLPVGTADQTIAMAAGQRANLVVAFDPAGNVTAVAGGGRFAGDWLTATDYLVSDVFRDPVTKNLYSTILRHTSTTIAADEAAGKVRLAVNVVDVELAKAAAQAARDRASEWANKTGADVDGTEFSAKEYATGSVVPTGSSKEWANQTGVAVDGSEFSAKEYATGAVVPSGSAKEWANQTGAMVDGAEYSAKEYAAGAVVPTGSAKEWANQTGATVDGVEYSAKEYASGVVVPTGSAKEWASLTGASVDGTEFSAKVYAEEARLRAQEAAIQATAAKAVAYYIGFWNTLSGPLNKPATVFHNGRFFVLLNDLADVTASEPGIATGDWAKQGVAIEITSYDNRASLRAMSPIDGDAMVVDGLGLFVWRLGSDEPDDDESCFATVTGRWLLEAAHWDVVDAWQAPDDAVRDELLESLESLELLKPLGTVLRGAATCAITSVATVSSATFTGTVEGAAVGDRVLAQPPAALGATAAETGLLAFHAWVSAADTVTIALTNASAATVNTNTAIRTAWPITVFKES